MTWTSIELKPRMEMAVWLREVMGRCSHFPERMESDGRRWAVEWRDSDYFFVFLDPRDAMLFKLRWGGSM